LKVFKRIQYIFVLTFLLFANQNCGGFGLQEGNESDLPTGEEVEAFTAGKGPYTIGLRASLGALGNLALFLEYYDFGDTNTSITEMQNQLNDDIVNYLSEKVANEYCSKYPGRTIYLSATARYVGQRFSVGNTGFVPYSCSAAIEPAPTPTPDPNPYDRTGPTPEPAPVPPGEPTPPAPSSGGSVGIDTYFSSGQSMKSENGNCELIYQGDGNLVVYCGGTPRWASNTFGTPGYAVFQGDGNLVVYDAGGTPRWASNTAGQGGSIMKLYNDGNIGIYRADGSNLWYAF
jgi:hypothetical protein